jgi:hypothetical protein
MVRVELALPLYDMDHRELGGALLWSIVEEVSGKCNGYSLALRLGSWTSENGELYREPVYFLTTDTSQENMRWFESRAEGWRQQLNQKEIYIVFHLIERI